MKTLFLIRHAKSSRDDASLPDRNRPLNDRGLHDAPMMGRRLGRSGVKPDLLVSSPALRALTTAQLVADAIGYPREDIAMEDSIYESSPERLLAIIRGLDGKLDCVMVFGHNPEFAGLAHRLAPEITEMPTCAVAELHFDTNAWTDIGVLDPAKVKLDTPKK
jgi:phosphohistidine phosphatase